MLKVLKPRMQREKLEEQKLEREIAELDRSAVQQAEKHTSEQQKLSLEIALLNKPWFKQPAYIGLPISLIAIITTILATYIAREFDVRKSALEKQVILLEEKKSKLIYYYKSTLKNQIDLELKPIRDDLFFLRSENAFENACKYKLNKPEDKQPPYFVGSVETPVPVFTKLYSSLLRAKNNISISTAHLQFTGVVEYIDLLVRELQTGNINSFSLKVEEYERTQHMTFSPQINFEDLKLPNELWGPADIVFCLREAREKGFEEFLKRAESVTRGRVAGRHYVDRLIRLLIFKIDSADYDRELNL